MKTRTINWLSIFLALVVVGCKSSHHSKPVPVPIPVVTRHETIAGSFDIVEIHEATTTVQVTTGLSGDYHSEDYPQPISITVILPAGNWRLETSQNGETWRYQFTVASVVPDNFRANTTAKAGEYWQRWSKE